MFEVSPAVVLDEHVLHDETGQGVFFAHHARTFDSDALLVLVRLLFVFVGTGQAVNGEPQDTENEKTKQTNTINTNQDEMFVCCVTDTTPDSHFYEYIVFVCRHSSARANNGNSMNNVSTQVSRSLYVHERVFVLNAGIYIIRHQ